MATRVQQNITDVTQKQRKCQTPSKTQMERQKNGYKDTSVCPLCLSGASILWGDEPRCFIEI